MKKIIVVLGFLFVGSTSLLAQKGQSSLSAGPLLSIPVDSYSRQYTTGYGVEVNGQYGVSPKSSVVAQAAILHYGVKNETFWAEPITDLTLKSGYRYQFGASAIYLNGLAGVDVDLSDGFTTIAFTLGGGKRFTFNNGRQLDIGLDYITGDVWVSALNIKAALLLFKKQKAQD